MGGGMLPGGGIGGMLGSKGGRPNGGRGGGPRIIPKGGGGGLRSGGGGPRSTGDWTGAGPRNRTGCCCCCCAILADKQDHDDTSIYDINLAPIHVTALTTDQSSVPLKRTAHNQ